MDHHEKERTRIDKSKGSQHNSAQSLLSSDNKALQDKDIKDLAKVGNPTAVGLLGGILHDKNDSFRKLAAQSLRIIENTRKDILTEFLKGKEKDAAKVVMAKATLSKIECLKLMLIHDLVAKDRQIRKLAAKALKALLEELRDERAVEPLIHLLRDEDRDIREIAAKALGASISEQHIEKLTAMLNGESNGVRWYVGIALIKFYKSQMKAMLFLIPTCILTGLFAYFVGPALIGKPVGALDLGQTIRGVAYLVWIACVIMLFILAKYPLRISRVKERMKHLDNER
jgi:plasmid stability protein